MTRSPNDWRALYPFDSHEIRVGSSRYHYVDQGEGDVLLMVHGNPTWSFYWRDLIRAFEGQHRVVVVDHLGCGLSDKPVDYPYCFAGHVENLTQLIDQLDLREITLVAHDWGGAIGLAAALARQDRFARLVLMNTAAWPPMVIPRRIRLCRTPILGRLALQGLNLFSRAALWMAAEHRERLTPEVRAGLLAPYDTWAHRAAVYQFVKDIPHRPGHPCHAALEELWQGLSGLSDRPVQLIWGMKDWCFTPQCLDRFLEVFPEADVHRLADAGHYVVLDAHERIVPLMEQFFDRNPLVAARP